MAKNKKTDTYEMEVNGRIIEITRKDILHLHVYVSPPFGALTASVPNDMDDKVVRAFIADREPWIASQIAKFDKRAWTDKRQFVSGETIWIFGKQCFLKVKPAKKMPFSYTGDAATLYAPEKSSVAKRRDFIYSKLKAELKRKIDGMLPDVMEETGVKVNDVIVGRWSTRWSSCVREKGNITVNGLLIHHSASALRLVLIYECLHLKYNPSTKIFRKKLEEIVPNWEAILDKMNAVPIPREW